MGFTHFQLLRESNEKVDLSEVDGTKEVNKERNRYQDIVPCEFFWQTWRVSLT
jgi:protein tyrosine phosphatase